jgi:purine-binding chemotaxis protein CheW
MSKDTDFQYVTFKIEGQLFGLNVMLVRDVLRRQRITPVPKAKREVRGVLNLRGQIVTAVDMRRRLGVEDLPDIDPMHIVVEHMDEAYSLVVDTVGEVMTLDESTFEKCPPTMPKNWAAIAKGIHRMQGFLLVALDLGAIMRLGSANGNG